MTTLLSRPNLRPVLWAAPLAGVLSALVNGVLFLLTRGAFEGVVAGPQETPFSPVPIVGLSFIASLAAGLVYALIARFARQPNRVFTVLAAVLLLVSFASPFSIPNVPTAVVLVLNLMHVVVFAFVLALIPRRGVKG